VIEDESSKRLAFRGFVLFIKGSPVAPTSSFALTPLLAFAAARRAAARLRRTYELPTSRAISMWYLANHAGTPKALGVRSR
jgi:hypothetical protein